MTIRRTSENGISFFGSGGHTHNGVNSTIIDVGSYSLFDFSLGYVGSQSRINRQSVNQSALEEWVIRIVNSKVLTPAGLDLAPDTLNGKTIRANTITADQISANTITANELSSNIVLINNVIRSNNYDGTIAANGIITSQGTAGWAITHAGDAVFSNTSIRGAIIANSVSTPGIDILANGAISSTNFNVTADGNITATGANITGTITSSSGTIGGWSIDSTKLSKTTGFNYVELVPALTNQGSSAIKVRWYDGSTTFQSTLAAQIFSAQSNGPGYSRLAIVDFNGFYVDQGGLDSASLSYTGVKIPNGTTIKATTSFATTGSSTTARLSQGDEAGFDRMGRPSSLRELKENIEDINDGLGILKSLRPRKYNFKVDAFSEIDPITKEPWTDEAREFATLDHKYGFIVDEVLEARPDLISYTFENNNDEEPNYLDFSKWKPTMWEDIDVLVLCVKAIQELSQKNDELEARLQALEGV